MYKVDSSYLYKRNSIFLAISRSNSRYINFWNSRVYHIQYLVLHEFSTTLPLYYLYVVFFHIIAFVVGVFILLWIFFSYSLSILSRACYRSYALILAELLYYCFCIVIVVHYGLCCSHNIFCFYYFLVY